MNKIKLKNPKAFSLIELAIVILIIGLVVASVLGGKKLVSLANLSKARALTNSSPVAGIEGLSVWFESISKNSFLSGEAIDGAVVSTWKDINPQVTNKKDVTATGAERPIYTENAINGLPALSFNGTSQFLSRANTFGYELFGTNQVTIFVVNKTISPAQNSAILQWQPTLTDRIIIHLPWVDNNIRFAFGDSTTSAGGLNNIIPSNFMDNWTITSIIRRPNNSGDISVNNSTIVSNSSLTSLLTNTATATFRIGSNDGITYHKGLIAEIIIFERALSDAERLEVTKYLSKKWGIAIN